MTLGFKQLTEFLVARYQAVVLGLSACRFLGLRANFLDALAHSCRFPLIVANLGIFVFDFTAHRVCALGHLSINTERTEQHLFHDARTPKQGLSLFVEREYEMVEEHEFFEGPDTDIVDERGGVKRMAFATWNVVGR